MSQKRRTLDPEDFLDLKKVHKKFKKELRQYSRKQEAKKALAQPRQRNHKTVLIAVYNFKGGVGKTTNLLQVASALASTSKVLMVDADPQCNLTSFVIPHPETGPIRKDEEKDKGPEEEEQEDGSEGKRQQSDSPVIDMHALKFIEPKDKISTKIFTDGIHQGLKDLHHLLKPAYTGKSGELLPPKQLYRPFGNENLFLIPGSPLISNFENQISTASLSRGTSTIYRGAFGKLLRDTAEMNEIDFVLVDFGPSSSYMNQIFVLSCDYILPPVFGDFYSASSVSVLLTVLIPQMLKNFEDLLREEKENMEPDQNADNYGFNKNVPRLLPFLVTNFHTYTKEVQYNVGRFVQVMRELVQADEVPKSVKDLYLPATCKQTAANNKTVVVGQEMVIPLVQDLGMTHANSQEVGLPPVELTDGLYGCDRRLVNYAKTKYLSLAAFLQHTCGVGNIPTRRDLRY